LALRGERGLSPHTIAAYRRDLFKYAGTLTRGGVSRWSAVTVDGIRYHLTSLKREGLTAASMARALSAIRMFHRFLVVEGVAAADPAAELESPKAWKRLPHALSLEEMERVLALPTPEGPLGLRDRALLEVMYATGMRISEALGLKLADVDLEARELRCLGKGGRERVVPFGQRAAEALRAYVNQGRPQLIKAWPDTGHVFVSRRGRAFSRVGLWKVIHGYLKAGGVGEKASPHTFRHTFATHLLMGGANLRSVQLLLGHANIATTQIYTHVDRRYLKDIHRRFHPRP